MTRGKRCGKVVVRRRGEGVSKEALVVEMVRRHTRRCDRGVHSGGRRSGRVERTEESNEVNTTSRSVGRVQGTCLI